MSYHTPKMPTAKEFEAFEDFEYDTSLGKVFSNGKEIGYRSRKDWYVIIDVRDTSRRFKRTHLIWWKHHGSWPTQLVDHEDRNKGNDAIKNLRYLDMSGNIFNSNDYRKSTNLPKGVVFDPRMKARPYKVLISRRNYSKYVGNYATPEEASDAFQKAYEDYKLKRILEVKSDSVN